VGVIGRTLSHYRVVEALGAGGMGEVYRARDEKLGRDVALKVLPAESLSDEAARRRLHKEAEALVRLSHPHIATLFDVDSAEGMDFLVMERVAGRTLEEELRRGPLEEKEVVRLGTQLLRALVAAHGHGVVHRDLKPSNLALTEDGLLKVLDFGLARLLREPERAVGETTATETAAGQVVGSPPYMAPEQLRGKETDERTDLYAAGAVLFELATGRRVFGTRNGVDLADAILHEPPPLPRSVAPSVSPGLEAVILKALDKDPGLRYQTAREMLVDLERLQQHSDAVSSTSRSASARVMVSTRSRAWKRGAMVTVAVTVLAAAAWVLWPPLPPRVTNVRPLAGGLDTTTNVTVAAASWATDGVSLYFLAAKGGRSALFQIPVTGGEAVERALPFPYYNFICGYLPDEPALLVTGDEHLFGGPEEGAALWVVPVPAGAPSRVGGLRTRRAAASPDGRTIAALNRKATILIARRDGSVEQELGPLPTEPEDLAWGPDGRRIRYTAAGPRRSGVSSSLWIWETSTDGGAPRALWPGAGGRWSGDGRYFVFARWDDHEHRSDLYAVREHRPLAPPASPVRLTSGPMSFSAPATSPDGKHLFAWGEAPRGQLLKWNPDARRFEKYLDGASVTEVDASRDGTWLAWVSYPDGTLWRGRPDGTDRLRLTARAWTAYLPRWSSDGRRVVFVASTPDEPRESLYIVPRDGGSPDLLVRNETDDDLFWDPCWEPGGQTILFSYFRRARRLGIHRIDLATREISLLPGSERFHYPKCSPRGDVLAFEKPPGGSPGELESRILRADRGAWEPIPEGIGAYASWSADGESVTSLDLDTKRLLRWSRATGRVEVVADVGDIPLLTAFQVAWTGLAPDGNPLIVRDRSMRDLYALEWEAP
jgi:Tol biopolymer transport system component/predicted Ser/Thr protein kinase